MPLNAGQMRHQVRLEQRVSTQDTAGEPTLSWALFAERRASIERMAGRELWGAEQRLGRVPTIFRLRWFDGVSPAMRLLWNGNVFDILSAIDPDGMSVELEVTALEHVDEVP